MHRRIAVVVLAILTVGLAAGAAIGAGTQPTPANAAVADGLSTATGTTTVVVQLPDHEPRIERPPERAATASSVNRTRKQTISAMESHAAATRAPLERFADGNPHVTIDRRLWLANAVVLTVDTDRVPLARLAGVDNVETIHENYRVSTSTTTETIYENYRVSTSTTTETIYENYRVSTSTTTANTPAPSSPASPLTTAPTTAATARPNSETTATTTTASDRRFTNALKLIDVPEAWQEFENRGEGVRVAVLDTGVNPDHPDIDIREENWKCYTDCRTKPNDVHGHGTHVSGTVVGGDANDAGLQIGVAPEATLMHAKVLNDTGSGTYGDIVAGMEWAVDNNATVVSMSLGGSGYEDAYIDPVRNAQASGTLVVAAVGNEGSDTSGSPANVYDATAVGSVDVQPGYPNSEGWNIDLTDDTVSEFSGGERIERSDWPEKYNDTPDDWSDSYVVPDVTAPGNIIWSADTNLDTRSVDNVDTTDLTLLQGTSMATPHVAGVVALMESNSANDLSPSELRTGLETTAVDIGAPTTRQGVGRVDADDAVAAVATTTTITPNITAAPNRVTAGRTLAVDYTATNSGPDPGATTLELRLNNTVVATTDTGTIAPGEQTTGTLSYPTTTADTGTRTVTLSSTDGSDTRTVQIVEPQVRLTNVSITPTQVSDTATTHTLTATMLNVSDDGQPDTVAVAMPEQIVVDGVTTATAVDTAGRSIPVANETATDGEITMTISPDSDATLRTVTVTTGFTARRTTSW